MYVYRIRKAKNSQARTGHQRGMAMGGRRTEEDEALAHNASHSIRDASVCTSSSSCCVSVDSVEGLNRGKQHIRSGGHTPHLVCVPRLGRFVYLETSRERKKENRQPKGPR